MPSSDGSDGAVMSVLPRADSETSGDFEDRHRVNGRREGRERGGEPSGADMTTAAKPLGNG